MSELLVRRLGRVHDRAARQRDDGHGALQGRVLMHASDMVDLTRYQLQKRIAIRIVVDRNRVPVLVLAEPGHRADDLIGHHRADAELADQGGTSAFW